MCLFFVDHAPTAPGTFDLECDTWKPVDSMFEQVQMLHRASTSSDPDSPGAFTYLGSSLRLRSLSFPGKRRWNWLICGFASNFSDRPFVVRKPRNSLTAQNSFRVLVTKHFQPSLTSVNSCVHRSTHLLPHSMISLMFLSEPSF